MFKLITRACGTAAGILTAIWLTALAIASSDGPGGVVVSPQLDSVAVAAISVCTTLGAGAWVVREVIRDEMGKDLVRSDEMNKDLARSVASSVSGLTIASLHEYVTGELREQVEVWIGRGKTRAMIEALDIKPVSTGNVASIRRGE